MSSSPIGFESAAMVSAAPPIEAVEARHDRSQILAVAVGDAVAIASTTTARATEAAALRRAAGSSRSGMDRDALMRRGWHGQARANEER